MPKRNRIIIDLQGGTLKSVRVDHRAGIRIAVRDFDGAGRQIANTVELLVGGVDEILAKRRSPRPPTNRRRTEADG